MKKIILWSIAAIILIDVTINYTIDSPTNNIKPSKLSQYFNYGRSIEGKLFRKVGDDNKTADSLAKAGWFKALENTELVNNTTLKQKRIFVYGMSFSSHIGKIISKYDKSSDVRMFDGPGAPLNHSYAYYQRHRPHKKGDTVILGILASSLPMVNTLTHMTSSFEGPAAHFYPKYRLNNDQLIKKQLAIYSLSELRKIMYDNNQWDHVKETLKKEDSFYDEILFSKNFTDKSVYLKLLKRAWGQRHKFKMLQRYHDKTGFKNTDQLIDISQAIVSNFARQVRDDGAIPIVMLFNNRGFDDHLHAILKSTLMNNNIQYYSSHIDFPATNLANFIPDGHFTHEIDISIAMKVMKKIDKSQNN